MGSRGAAHGAAPRARRGSRDSGLRAAPGDEIPGDPEQPLGDPEAAARTICLRQLERRARSRVELADVLVRRGVPEDAANRVLDRFVEVGLIDDTALAIGMAEAQHRDRGLARRAVAVKLRRRGIDDDTVDEALAGIDPESERARARELVARRAPALQRLTPEVRARRLVALLARNGYAPGVAYGVVRDVVGELEAAEFDTG